MRAHRATLTATLTTLAAIFLGALLLAPCPARAAGTIAAAECFFDLDPGQGLGTPLTAADGAFDEPEEDIDVSTIDSSALAPGLHYLHVRFQDNEGAWGPTREVSFTTFGVAAAEYYIDTDPGVGHGTALPPTDGSFGSGEEEVSLADVSVRSLPPGIHQLFVRFRDAWGRWGASQGIEFLILPNQAPSFVKGADQTVLEDAGALTVPGWATDISAGVPGESWQELNFIVTNDNNGLFATQPAVSPVGTLTCTPAANANGSATVTVVLHDNGGTVNGGVDTSAPQTFLITVTPVNDAPSFTKGADQTVLKDAGPQTVAGWASGISTGPGDEAGQTLDYQATNDNNALFAVQPAVSADGTLTYTPAASAAGNATVTVRLHDDGGTANGGVDTSAPQTFQIAVLAINQAPSFVKGPDQTVLEDAVPQIVTGWATGISAGPADEAGQTLDFQVTNDNNALFAVQPVVSADGTLTYTAAENANGGATVTVRLHDDGGTANGGIDTSSPQTFLITVTAENDAPVLEPIGGRSVREGKVLQIVVSATDVDGDTLDYTATGLPPGSSFNASTRTFTWMPWYNHAGVWKVTFQVRDTGDLAAAETVAITVRDPASPRIFWDQFSHGAAKTDPDFRVVSGSWALASGHYGALSLRTTNLSRVLLFDPVSFPLKAEVIQVQARITAPPSGEANAAIVFAFQDATHYRFLRLVPRGFEIGQVGSLGAERGGVRKTLLKAHALNTWYTLKLKVHPDGSVQVFQGNAPVGSFKFRRAVAGGVGLSANRGRATFDALSILDDSMLAR